MSKILDINIRNAAKICTDTTSLLSGITMFSGKVLQLAFDTLMTQEPFMRKQEDEHIYKAFMAILAAVTIQIEKE